MDNKIDLSSKQIHLDKTNPLLSCLFIIEDTSQSNKLNKTNSELIKIKDNVSSSDHLLKREGDLTNVPSNIYQQNYQQSQLTQNYYPFNNIMTYQFPHDQNNYLYQQNYLFNNIQYHPLIQPLYQTAHSNNCFPIGSMPSLASILIILYILYQRHPFGTD